MSRTAIVKLRPAASDDSTMDWTKCLAVFCFCHLQLVTSAEPPCVVDLQCAECVPDNMPLVSALAAAHGDEVWLSCGAGRLLAFPLRSSLAARCEAGRYRVPLDGSLRHLLELGCQENVFEDVLHAVEHCPPPLVGRAYQLQQENSSIRHLATVCFDEDRAVATFARVSNAPANALRLAPHSDRRAPLTLFGNFNSMFDSNTRHVAEKLYSDDVRMNRRLRELFKYDKFSFAEQNLTAAGLLSGQYFDDQNARVADFVSNKVAAWGSVASGNLEHVQRDVAKFLKMSRPHATVDVYAGTHGNMSLRTGHTRKEIYLRGERFPVPKYIWTVVLDRAAGRGLALVVLNDPFVAVSEIREAVFCESACARVSWLQALRRQRNYESALYGLAFCCDVHSFAAVARELPAALLADVRAGRDGMLTELNT
ncbi:unnamed protein product [Euphydryas editha]|uniref:DNA/RNA non-specific endonuclease/pyrophosphatase/phosphodiesterase domain-containing protein n=1 Tax=Euphydryas editha TaxID=104508 RepID=A0AAU9TXI2_EUPED|nr:unnamed protein product [Euphydryas editha]